MAMLNSLFGKGKQQVGDVEFWHGNERAGWLMKQGVHLRVVSAVTQTPGRSVDNRCLLAGEFIKTWRRR